MKHNYCVLFTQLGTLNERHVRGLTVIVVTIMRFVFFFFNFLLMSEMSRGEETSLFIVRLAQRLSIIASLCLHSGAKALD